MTEAQQAVLDKWAEVAAEYAAIEEFDEWAGGLGAEYPLPSENKAPKSARNLLDEYFGINRKDLEAARRALSQEAREQHGLSEKGAPS